VGSFELPRGGTAGSSDVPDSRFINRPNGEASAAAGGTPPSAAAADALRHRPANTTRHVQ
jgi:hypothetical protein